MRISMVTDSPRVVERTYLALMLLSTLAASLIWGINTLFLLDAGLNNTQAFAANAFFTVGQVLFEVPTGVVADTWGRRASYLLGTITLSASTFLYLFLWYISAPFVWWAVVSVLLGLGFTFFSGATEAWLVDALDYTKYKGKLDSVFAHGQAVSGVAMLVGSVAGGFIAQATSLGVPFLLRGFILLITFAVAFALMRDLGFTPRKSAHPWREVKKVLNASLKHGFGKPSVRALMLSAPFTVGIGFYAFYALQPHLLNIYGNQEAYGIAGLAAAIVAGAQVAGSMLVPTFRKFFAKRTTILLLSIAISSLMLIAVGFVTNFWVTIGLLVIWALMFAAAGPVRQALLNGLIPSKQRATVLSFDSLMGSSGGVFTQPALGRVADVYSYATSFLVAGVIQLFALPFILSARRQNLKEDTK